MDGYFATWLRALETDAVTLHGDGAGQVLVSYNDSALVGATITRAIAYA
jgi:hypothetical protein